MSEDEPETGSGEATGEEPEAPESDSTAEAEPESDSPVEPDSPVDPEVDPKAPEYTASEDPEVAEEQLQAERKAKRLERREKRRNRRYNNFQRGSFYIYTVILVFLLTLGLLWSRVFILIPPGHHGVLYQPLFSGTVTDPEKIHGEGLHIIPPWDTLFVYETRLQQRMVRFQMLSDEGLQLQVQVSVRFRADRDMLGFLHQDIGETYYERLIAPEVEGHVRETLGNRPAHEIYASAGDLIQELNHVTTLTRVGEASAPYVVLQEVKLVNVSLPSIVEQAIAERYRQEQLRLEYADRIAREEQEAERKRIEAKGISDYNDIVGDIALRWRDLEAAKALATSPNSKIILLGNSGDSNPLLFSLSADTGTPSETPAPTTEPSTELPPAEPLSEPPAETP